MLESHVPPRPPSTIGAPPGWDCVWMQACRHAVTTTGVVMKLDCTTTGTARRPPSHTAGPDWNVDERWVGASSTRWIHTRAVSRLQVVADLSQPGEGSLDVEGARIPRCGLGGRLRVRPEADMGISKPASGNAGHGWAQCHD